MDHIPLRAPCPVPSLRAPGYRCPREQTCVIRRPVMLATDQTLACSARTRVSSSSGWLDGIRRCAQAEAQGSGIKKIVAILLASYLFLHLVSSISVHLVSHFTPHPLTWRFFYWQCIWGCLHPLGRIWMSKGCHPGLSKLLYLSANSYLSWFEGWEKHAFPGSVAYRGVQMWAVRSWLVCLGILNAKELRLQCWARLLPVGLLK